MRFIALALAAFSVPLVAGCGLRPGYPPNPMLRPTAVTDFAPLYNQNCAACHGQNGQNGPSIDLANPEYQAFVDDASLRKWISGGMPGTEMPAFAQSAGGMLTSAQVDALVAGMRRNWRRPNAFDGAAPPSYAQAEAGDPGRGQLTYQARCAQCHEPSHDSANQQITSPRYLALVGNQALRTIIIAGRPDIGQPDWRHDGPGGEATAPLSAADVDNIVAYLASLRNLGQPAAAGTASSQTTPAGR
jgi:mono/diheme cytochrome c family protein